MEKFLESEEKFRETREIIKKLADEVITLEECKKGIIELDKDLDNYYEKMVTDFKRDWSFD